VILPESIWEYNNNLWPASASSQSVVLNARTLYKRTSLKPQYVVHLVSYNLAGEYRLEQQSTKFVDLTSIYDLIWRINSNIDLQYVKFDFGLDCSACFRCSLSFTMIERSMKDYEQRLHFKNKCAKFLQIR